MALQILVLAVLALTLVASEPQPLVHPTNKDERAKFVAQATDFTNIVMTLDNYQTSRTGVKLTVVFTPFRTIAAGGSIHIQLSAHLLDAGPTLDCSAGSNTPLPSCSTAVATSSGIGVAEPVVSITLPSGLTPGVTHQFSVSSFTNPAMEGRPTDDFGFNLDNLAYTTQPGGLIAQDFRYMENWVFGDFSATFYLDNYNGGASPVKLSVEFEAGQDFDISDSPYLLLTPSTIVGTGLQTLSCTNPSTVYQNALALPNCNSNQLQASTCSGSCNPIRINLGGSLVANTNYSFEITGLGIDTTSGLTGFHSMSINIGTNAANHQSDIEKWLLIDNIPPVLTNCPGNISSFTDIGQPGANLSWAAPTATDNLVVSQIVYSHQSGDQLPIGTTRVTITALDASGNSDECWFEATVTDNENPVVTCPADITQGTDTDANVATVTWNTQQASDNSGVVATLIPTVASGSTFSAGSTTTVRYDATDAAGNTALCTFQVTIIDNQPPTITCPASVTVSNAPGENFAVVSWTTPATFDNVMVTDLSLTLPVGFPYVESAGVVSANFSVGATTIQYTVTDSAGAQTSCSFVVTVEDTELPVITCPANISISTDPGRPDANVSWADPMTSDNVGVIDIVRTVDPGTLFNVGPSQDVTYTIKDAALNSVSCTFSVLVTDLEAPTMECSGDIFQTTNAGAATAVVHWPQVNVTDNVGVLTVTQSHTSGSSFGVGNTTIQYNATDAQGNLAICTWVVAVRDTEPPTITCPNDITNAVTDPGQPTSTVTWPTPTTADNLGVFSVVPYPGGPGTAFPIGQSTVLYTVTDTGSNTASCSFDITVYDFEKPQITCPGTQLASTGASTSNAIVNWPAPATSDNNNISTVISDRQSGELFEQGTTFVTYNVTDPSGNWEICVFNVTVQDFTAPNVTCPANITHSTDPSVNNAVVRWLEPVPYDNVGVVSFTVAPMGIGATYPLGSTEVTYTAVDVDGNVATCTFTITILDQEDPQITCPDSQTIILDPGQGTKAALWPTPNMFDNVGVTLVTQSHASNDQFPYGVNTVQYNVSDAAGNTDTCSFTVTVLDQEDPQLTCPADIVQNNDAGLASAVVTWTEPTMSDNVAVASYTQTYFSGHVFGFQEYYVYYFAKDPAGNEGNCSFTVTIQDVEAPNVTCPTDVFILLAEGQTSSVATWTVDYPVDNHKIQSWVGTSTPGDTFIAGDHTVTYTATDPSGNQASCSFLVIISDFIPTLALDQQRTCKTGTTITAQVTPRYTLAAGGMVSLILGTQPDGFVDMTTLGMPTLGCASGTNSALPGCNSGLLTISSDNTTLMVAIPGGGSLTAGTTYEFSLGNLRNPCNPGYTSMFDVRTVSSTGSIQDRNPEIAPFFITSVLLNATTGSVAEGSTISFSAVLDTIPPPMAIIPVTLTSQDTTQMTVGTSPITFTTENWNVTQYINVMGVVDQIDDDDQTRNVIPSVSTSSAEFNGLEIDAMAVTVVDVDTAGLVASTAAFSVTENTAVTFTVHLASKPVQTVVVMLTSSDTSRLTLDMSSLTFSAATWDLPQTVAASAVHDIISNGDAITTIGMTTVTSDAKYTGQTASIAATVLDDDVAAIIVDPSSATVQESSVNPDSATFSARLATQPTGTVTLTLASADTTEVAPAVSTLTFTTSNWNTPQSFVVNMVDDNSFDGTGPTAVTLTASGNTYYNSGVTASVNIYVTEDEVVGAAFQPTLDYLFVTHELASAGTPQILNVALNTAPTGTTIVRFTSTREDQGGVVPSYLTFEASNYNTQQQVQVVGNDDLELDGPQNFTVMVTFEAPSGDAYNSLAYNFTAVNMPREYVDAGPDSDIFSFCINGSVYSYSSTTFASTVATTFGVDVTMVSTDSHRSCGSNDLAGIFINDQTYIKYKAQAVHDDNTLVNWHFTGLTSTILGGRTVYQYQLDILNQIRTNYTIQQLLAVSPGANPIIVQASDFEVPTGNCQRTATRYFGVSLTVLTRDSEISPVVYAVVPPTATNPIFLTDRAANDTVQHPMDGLRLFAEDGNYTALLAELAAKKAAYPDLIGDFGVAAADENMINTLSYQQTAHFGFHAAPGDRIVFATSLQKSNDMFYGTSEYGVELFGATCRPQFDTDMALFLYDAGTEVNQGFWASYQTGQQSEQPGGGNLPNKVPEAGLVAQVSDSLFTLLVAPYPRPATLLRGTIDRGLDITLTPLVHSAKNAQAVIDMYLPMHTGIGNEIRVTFPSGWFKFNSGGTTTATVLMGLHSSVTTTPSVSIMGDTVTMLFNMDLVVVQNLQRISLSNLELPPVCGEQPYTLETFSCVDRNIHNASKYYAHECGDALVSVTSRPPNGMPQACTLCDACVWQFKNQGEDWYTCYTPEGLPFLRVGPLDNYCAANPYNTPGWA